MASRRIPTLEELHCMRRADLQKLAKDYNIKANLKTEMLIEELMRVRARHSTRTPVPSNTSKFRSSRKNGEEERKPTPRSPSTSDLSSVPDGTTATAHVRKQNHTLASSSKSRIPIGAPRVVSKMMIPPGVLAANSAGGKGKHVLGNSTYESTAQAHASKSKYRRAEEIKQDQEMEDAMPFVQGDRTSGSSTPQRTPGRQTSAYPESTSSWTLERRIANLETSHKLSKTKQENEMTTMRSLLSQAQENISELVRENDELRQRLDSAPTVEEISHILTRLSILEDKFQSGAHPTASISSSEAELAMNRPRLTWPKFETPPNTYARRETQSVAPVARNSLGDERRERPQHARTPPPQFGRYPLNAPGSPSPTRVSKWSSTLIAHDPDGSGSGSQSSLYRSLNPTPGAYPRGGYTHKLQQRGAEPTKRSRRDSSGGGSPSPDDNTTMRGDSPSMSVKKERSERPLGSDLVPYSDSRLLNPLPHAIESSPEPQSSYSEAERASVAASASRSRTKRPAARPPKSARRSHPYARPLDLYMSVGGADEDAPANITATTSRAMTITATPAPKPAFTMRDMFGSTPDLEYIPPSPLGDGIPVLDLGASREDAEASQPSTPMPTLMKSVMTPVDETPLVARTLYGTEFGTAMRAKFSDA